MMPTAIEYLGMKGVVARDALTTETDIGVLSYLIEADTRTIVTNKAKARVRALNLKPSPAVETVLVLDDEKVPVDITTTTEPVPGPPSLVVLEGGGSAVDRAPFVPFLVPEPKPPSKVKRFSDQEMEDGACTWGAYRACSKCKQNKPLQLRRMQNGKVRPQAQCGQCRGQKPATVAVVEE